MKNLNLFMIQIKLLKLDRLIYYFLKKFTKQCYFNLFIKKLI
jgi:hypothetical protein